MCLKKPIQKEDLFGRNPFGTRILAEKFLSSQKDCFLSVHIVFPSNFERRAAREQHPSPSILSARSPTDRRLGAGAGGPSRARPGPKMTILRQRRRSIADSSSGSRFPASSASPGLGWDTRTEQESSWSEAGYVAGSGGAALEDAASRRIIEHWRLVEAALYEDESQQPLAPGSLLDECIQWREQLAHLRLLGRRCQLRESGGPAGSSKPSSALLRPGRGSAQRSEAAAEPELAVVAESQDLFPKVGDACV